jgi:hypothetical protein
MVDDGTEDMAILRSRIRVFGSPSEMTSTLNGIIGGWNKSQVRRVRTCVGAESRCTHRHHHRQRAEVSMAAAAHSNRQRRSRHL